MTNREMPGLEEVAEAIADALTCTSWPENIAAAIAAYPIIERALREKWADKLEAYAENYPEDVFPPISDSRDAIGGTAMRHAYRNAARIIRGAATEGEKE